MHAKSSIAVTGWQIFHILTVRVALLGLMRSVVRARKGGVGVLLRSILGVGGLSSLT